MRVGAVVHARMSSARLPGKVLREIAGRPLLAYLVERLQHATGLDTIVVATSSDGRDDAVAVFASSRGLACHRGPLDDVATRVLEAAERYDLDAVVRLSGDSPLLDQRLVERAVRLFVDGRRCDLVTNVHPRTYPRGQSVEVVGTDTLRRALDRMTTEDREHVTPFFYRNRTSYRIVNFTSEQDRSRIGLTVDTEPDARRIEAIIMRMTRPHWEYGLDDILELFREVA